MVEAATVDRLLETVERRLARLEEASDVALEAYRASETSWRTSTPSSSPSSCTPNLERLDDIRDCEKSLLPHLRPGRR